MHVLFDRAFGLLNRGSVAMFQVPTDAAGCSFDAAAYMRGLDKPGVWGRTPSRCVAWRRSASSLCLRKRGCRACSF